MISCSACDIRPIVLQGPGWFEQDKRPERLVAALDGTQHHAAEDVSGPLFVWGGTAISRGHGRIQQCFSSPFQADHISGCRSLLLHGS